MLKNIFIISIGCFSSFITNTASRGALTEGAVAARNAATANARLMGQRLPRPTARLPMNPAARTSERSLLQTPRQTPLSARAIAPLGNQQSRNISIFGWKPWVSEPTIPPMPENKQQALQNLQPIIAGIHEKTAAVLEKINALAATIDPKIYETRKFMGPIWHFSELTQVVAPLDAEINAMLKLPSIPSAYFRLIKPDTSSEDALVVNDRIPVLLDTYLTALEKINTAYDAILYGPGADIGIFDTLPHFVYVPKFFDDYVDKWLGEEYGLPSQSPEEGDPSSAWNSYWNTIKEAVKSPGLREHIKSLLVNMAQRGDASRMLLRNAYSIGKFRLNTTLFLDAAFFIEVLNALRALPNKAVSTGAIQEILEWSTRLKPAAYLGIWQKHYLHTLIEELKRSPDYLDDVTLPIETMMQLPASKRDRFARNFEEQMRDKFARSKGFKSFDDLERHFDNRFAQAHGFASWQDVVNQSSQRHGQQSYQQEFADEPEVSQEKGTVTTDELAKKSLDEMYAFVAQNANKPGMLLGIDPKLTTKKQLNASFTRLMGTFHPDILGENKQTDAIAKALNRARDSLKTLIVK